jgi:hypothetical protein
MCVILSVFYRNVSAALFLLNKVHNSIYSKKYALRVNFVNLNRTNKQSCGGRRCSIYIMYSLPKICTIWMISYLRFVCFLVQPDGSIEDLKDNLFCLE